MLPTVTRLIENGMDDGLHLGAQVYVTRAGEAVADLAIGEVAAGGASISSDSIALWMSAGKPVTAVAVAQQCELGELDLDAPVAEYLPAFAAHGKHDITVRHLLMHTAGIGKADYKFPDDDWDAIIAAICDTPAVDGWGAGEKAGYDAMSAWMILGELVRLADGRGIDRYAREMIFEPLGMLDSWMGMPPETYDGYDHAGRLMQMPNTFGRAVRKSSLTSKAWCTRPRPGGNCMGPMRELVRFYEMLLSGGALGGATILEPATVEAITGRRRVGMYDQTFKRTVDWGLGFVVNSARYAPLDEAGEPDLMQVPYGYGPYASPETFGHSGAQSSVGFADPSCGLAVGIVLNGMPGEMAHQRRMLPVLGALYGDLGLG